MMRASSRLIRSPSSFSSLVLSVMGRRLLVAFAQTVTERDAFVEHEALAAPAALGRRNLLEVFQDAAPEMIDLVEAAREQEGAGLFAADPAGAEHGYPSVLGGVEFARGEILELAEACNAGIDRARKGAHPHLKGVAGIEHQRIG